MLLRWFDIYNADSPYRKRMRPFGFLPNLQHDPLAAFADLGEQLDDGTATR